MARIRSIKPEFFTSETVAQLSDPAKVTFIGLWTECDDYGVAVDNPKLLKGHLWPLDDTKTAVDVSLHIHEMVELGVVRRFEAEGRKWLAVVGFGEHQRINRPSKTRNPEAPWTLSEPSVSPHGALSEPQRDEHGDCTTCTENSLSEHSQQKHEPSQQKRVGGGGGGGSGDGKGGGGGSGSPAPQDRLPNPFAGMNGHATTTDLHPTTNQALHVVVARLTQQRNPDDPESYRHRLLQPDKAAEHVDKLDRLRVDNPTLDGNEIAELYMARRTKQPRKPRCGICGADAHPNGPVDCPKMGA